MVATAHFTTAELACRCGCGLATFHDGFLVALESLRRAFDEPMSITSACRCTAHNEQIGGHPNSLHVGDREQHPGQKGALAVDVATPNGAYRGRLFATAWRLGWSIGWNARKGFLHLDRRIAVGLAQNSFDYDSKVKP